MYYFKDITEQKYGALTALYPTEKRDSCRGIIWMFQCDCGNKVEYSATRVKRKYVRSCGCGIDGKAANSNPQKNLLNKRFGKLVVIEQTGKTNTSHSYYSKVKCDCGTEFMAKDSDLLNGTKWRCRWCHFREKRKYEVTDKRLLGIWRAMRKRCNDPTNERYSSYGGRGIKVCEKWDNSFEEFYKWSIEHGYEKNLTIDRKDNDGNYEPDNCRWATYAEQNRNKRNNRFIDYEGKQMIVKDVANLTGISRATIDYRLKHGWNDFDATHIAPSFDNSKLKSKG